ncbi:hypothetical protein VE03_10594, partial [Pseudogymnoascus sp. 23342-1-I1]
MRLKRQKDETDRSSVPENVADQVIVKDVDMERVALDRTLGRLWRGWKKRLRSPNDSTDSRDASLIQKTTSGSLTIKASCPLANQVNDMDIGATVPEVIEPETVALGIDTATLKPPVPVRSPLRGAQKTKLTQGSCPKSSRFALVMKNASDTSDEFPRGGYSGLSKKDARLLPALRSAPPSRSAAYLGLNARDGRDAKVTSKSSSGIADSSSTGLCQSHDDFAVEPLRQTNTSAHRMSAPYVPIVVTKPLATTGTYNRLQARDAVVHSGNLSSSKLIDFIRQGPPNKPPAFDQEDTMPK